MWVQFQPVTGVDLPLWHYHLHSTPVSNPELFRFWCQFSSWTSDSNCYSFLSASSVVKVSFVRVHEINVVCLLVSLTHVMWPAARTVCSHSVVAVVRTSYLSVIFFSTLLFFLPILWHLQKSGHFIDYSCLDLPFYIDMFLQVATGLWIGLFSEICAFISISFVLHLALYLVCVVHSVFIFL